MEFKAAHALTPAEYAASFTELLKQGRTVRELSEANHLGREMGLITFAQFRAAARVLAKEILER